MGEEWLKKPTIRYGAPLIAVLVLIQYVLLPWHEWRSELVQTMHERASLMVRSSDLDEGAAELESMTILLNEQINQLSARYLTIQASELDAMKVDAPTSLRQRAIEANIGVNRISAVKELLPVSDTIARFSLAFEVQGTADDVLTFLSDIESQSPIFSIATLRFSSINKTSLKAQLEVIQHVIIQE